MSASVKVPDMMCEGCEKTIREKLSRLDGVEQVRVDLDTKVVNVEGSATREQVFKAIQDAGYKPEGGA